MMDCSGGESRLHTTPVTPGEGGWTPKITELSSASHLSVIGGELAASLRSGICLNERRFLYYQGSTR